MIVFDWLVNALYWTAGAMVYILKALFVQETIEEKIVRLTLNETKNIQELRDKLDLLMVQQHDHIIKMAISSTTLSSKVSDALDLHKTRKSCVPVIEMTIKNHIYRLFNDQDDMIWLKHYFKQCICIGDNFSLEWTNEHGLCVSDPDLWILSSIVQQIAFSRHIHTNIEDIKNILFQFVLQKEEVQQLLQEWIPVSKDIYRFVIQKYL